MGGLTGGSAGDLGDTGALGDAVSPLLKLDKNAPVMTLPAAQLGGSSLSFQGLKSVSLVKVRLAGGKTTPVIKLVADEIAINGFLLDVRGNPGPGGLVTNADRMELTGHVVVYLDSVSATTLGGLGFSLGLAKDPPAGSEVPSTLLRPTLGLVGVTANLITFSNTNQEIQP